jgi:uncharacterized membrane protein YphA (DoxX/SURF4 family)
MHHKNYDWALLVLRVVVGIVFIAHGWDKWQNLSGTTGFFASVGLPVFLVYVVALIELLGGLAILLGVKTRLAGYLLAVVMAGAILSVGMDEKGVRVFFPELTSERRTTMLKLAKEKIEEARASLRSARDDVWSDIQKKEREGEVTEDEKFRFKDEMQKRIDAANKAFDDALARKEKEIAS